MLGGTVVVGPPVEMGGVVRGLVQEGGEGPGAQSGRPVRSGVEAGDGAARGRRGGRRGGSREGFVAALQQNWCSRTGLGGLGLEL